MTRHEFLIFCAGCWLGLTLMTLVALWLMRSPKNTPEGSSDDDSDDTGLPEDVEEDRAKFPVQARISTPPGPTGQPVVKEAHVG